MKQTNILGIIQFVQLLCKYTRQCLGSLYGLQDTVIMVLYVVEQIRNKNQHPQGITDFILCNTVTKCR